MLVGSSQSFTCSPRPCCTKRRFPPTPKLNQSSMNDSFCDCECNTTNITRFLLYYARNYLFGSYATKPPCPQQICWSNQPRNLKQKTKGRFIFCSLKFLSEVFRISSEQTPPPSFTITNHKNESSNSLTQRSNAISNSTSFLLQKTADHPTSLPGEIFRCPRGKTTIWVAAQHSGRFPRRHAQHPERRCAPKGHFSGYQEFYGSNGHGDQK